MFLVDLIVYELDGVLLFIDLYVVGSWCVVVVWGVVEVEWVDLVVYVLFGLCGCVFGVSI